MPLDPIHLFHYVEFHVFTFLLMISVIFWWWFLILLFTHPLTYPFLFSPLLFSILLLPRVCVSVRVCVCMCSLSGLRPSCACPSTSWRREGSPWWPGRCVRSWSWPRPNTQPLLSPPLTLWLCRAAEFHTHSWMDRHRTHPLALRMYVIWLSLLTPPTSPQL